jgi:hypothetical protein
MLIYTVMNDDKTSTKTTDTDEKTVTPTVGEQNTPQKEYGGVAGKSPTEYNDWQHKGRCTDF